MLEIIAHAVTTKWQHSKGITSHYALLTHCCSRGLGPLRRRHIHAFGPVTRLGHQGDGVRAPAAEYKRIDGHAGRVIPFGIDHWVLIGSDGKPSVGVRGFASGIGCPVASLPVEAMLGSGPHAFPPYVTVVG